MKLAPIALTATFIAINTLPAMANETVVPGKSLWGFKLGDSRQKAIQAAPKNLPKAKRQPSKNLAGGLVWDSWDIGGSENLTLFDMLSRSGKVVQLRYWTMTPKKQPKQTFAQLLKAHALKKNVYSFIDPNGGGYVGFYYTDLRRGITYTGGTQDAFVLTSRPDGVIVQKPGIAEK